LNSAILRAGRNNHAGLTGFRFNPYTGIEQLFPQQPVFSNDGTLRIPAQHLDTPAGVTKLEEKLIASRIDFANRRITGSDAAVLYIDPAQPFEGAEMSVDTPGKGTLMVILQVRMYMNGEITHNRRYTAADILAVVENQAQEAAPAKTQPRKTLSRLLPEEPGKLATTIGGQVPIQRE
jgi:hypothetical protein